MGNTSEKSAPAPSPTFAFLAHRAADGHGVTRDRERLLAERNEAQALAARTEVQATAARLRPLLRASLRDHLECRGVTNYFYEFGSSWTYKCHCPVTPEMELEKLDDNLRRDVGAELSKDVEPHGFVLYRLGPTKIVLELKQ